jgi:hypothetical protein
VLRVFGERVSKTFCSSRIVVAGLLIPFTPSLAPAGATAGIANAGLPNVIAGQVRVQLLSDSLVRLELRGREGFEDRTTFHIESRDWPGTAFSTNVAADQVAIRTANYTVHVPQNAMSLNDVRVESPDGKELFHWTGALDNSKWLPGPADKPAVWSFADAPRLVPPSWGLTVAPAGSSRPETSGWDLSNDSPDIYVFVPRGDYRRLRRDFLQLTGPTEMVPLFALGAFDSRWHDYSETTALQQIDDYRAREIPLDVLVVDTGWRQNASTGYRPNTNLFPDLSRFFREAHAKHVCVMLNDHPEPVSNSSLDPKELQYRFAGLSGLLEQGLDFWWYDRNWMVALVAPAPSLHKEVWGMRTYHDMTQKVRPRSRPLILANVDGIDNGIRDRPPDVAAHRFPIQWTGDIGPGFEYLRRGVENAVYSGVQALFPYMSEDLGGHTSNPGAEQYIRWIEYGALSPVYRPHCTHDLMRMPWTFGPEAERVARRFLNMRYRLLPVFYAAARENYETGEPLLRRLDLDYPHLAEASRNDEYLIGKSILVAPVLQGSLTPVPAEWLKTPGGNRGLQAEYFPNEELSGTPVLTRTDAAVDFNWGKGSPAPNVPNHDFSARWTGTIQVPQPVGDVVLATVEDDGARAWIDGRQVINAWGPHDSTLTEASTGMSAGKPHRLRIEYQQLEGNALIQFQWHRRGNDFSAVRVAWIPPGAWINAWTGEKVSGPATITNNTPAEQTPIYIRSGAILPLAPEMQYTGERPWDPITLDLYPHSGETNQTILYEDDTLTTAYREGRFRKTTASVSADAASKTVRVEIGPAEGAFSGALNTRAWVLRLHRPLDWPENLVPGQVKADGRKFEGSIRRLVREATAMPFGDKSGAPDSDLFELSLPAASASKAWQVEVSLAASENP